MNMGVYPRVWVKKSLPFKNLDPEKVSKNKKAQIPVRICALP